MDEYVIPIFLAAFGGTTLSLGAWLVRALTRSMVVTMWGVHVRATDPVAYWFWAIYHVLGMTLVIVVAVAIALEALVSVAAGAEAPMLVGETVTPAFDGATNLRIEGAAGHYRVVSERDGTRCERALGDGRALAVAATFRHALRHGWPKTGGLDGVTYEFAAGPLRGDAFMPEAGTPAAKLGDIGEALSRYCTLGRYAPGIAEGLMLHVDALTARGLSRTPDEHLRPASRYYDALTRWQYDEAFGPDVLLRMQVMPRMPDPAYMVWIARDGTAYRIVAAEPRIGIDLGPPPMPNGKGVWHLPPHPPQVKPGKRCEAQVAGPLALRIADLWQEMLEATAPQKQERVILDGEYFDASMPEMPEEGAVHSPPEASRPGLMVAIAKTMKRYCDTGSQAALAALEHGTAALERRLETVP